MGSPRLGGGEKTFPRLAVTHCWRDILSEAVGDGGMEGREGGRKRRRRGRGGRGGSEARLHGGLDHCETAGSRHEREMFAALTS